MSWLSIAVSFDCCRKRARGREAKQRIRVDVAPQNTARLDFYGNYVYGRTQGYSYNSTRTTYSKYVASFFLDFMVYERGWNTGKAQYRQTLFFNGRSHEKQQLNLARLQARRGGKPWNPVTPAPLKTKDKAKILEAISNYYNAPLNAR